MADGSMHYSGEFTKCIKITPFYFWKIAFFFSASIFMIHRFINYFIYAAIYSECGLKAALYSDPFASGFTVDQRTGRVCENLHTIKETVTSKYREIKE